MKKPIIGIVSRPGIIFGKYDVQVTEETYKNAILECGGIPITILPPQMLSYQSIPPKDVPQLSNAEKEDLNQILNRCDAILSPGGLKTYEYDYYICDYAKKNNIPMLGICAGMQVMAKNGSNFKFEKTNIQIHKPENKKYAHDIRIKNNTLLYDIIGKDTIKVNSFHSYNVPNGGTNIECAYSIEDSIIEAIEDPNLNFYLGVQWHPEKLVSEDENSKRLFKRFINEATNNRIK